MISSDAEIDGEEILKEVAGLDHPRAARAGDLDARFEREHDRRIVGRGIGVREAAAERAAIADLRIADLTGGIGHHRALLTQHRGRGHVVVHGRGADLDLAVLLANAGEARNAGDVDERRRLAEPQLHQRHQAVAAGEQFPARILQLLDRLVHRRRAVVVELGRNHA